MLDMTDLGFGAGEGAGAGADPVFMRVRVRTHVRVLVLMQHWVTKPGSCHGRRIYTSCSTRNWILLTYQNQRGELTLETRNAILQAELS
jgi:hypothetical protein